MVSTLEWRANHDRTTAGRDLLATIAQPFVWSQQIGSGESTRLACGRWRLANDFLVEQEKHFGEAPKFAREARALPGKEELRGDHAAQMLFFGVAKGISPSQSHFGRD